MSGLEVVLYGCLGGAVGYVLAYLLPFAKGLWDGKLTLKKLTAARIAGLIGIAGAYILLGGIAAVIVQSDTIKLAIITGIGFEGVFHAATTKADLQ